MNDQVQQLHLLMEAREHLWNKDLELALRLARDAADDDSADPQMRVASKTLLEAALRISGDYQAALDICKDALSIPELAQVGRTILERSAARNEWLLGKHADAVQRLKKLIELEGNSESTTALLLEIRNSLVGDGGHADSRLSDSTDSN